MMAVFLCAVVMWLWIQLQGGLIVAAILLAIPAAICTVVVLIRRNTAQQETILQALAIAAARSLPLAPAALAFADQFGRSFRSRVQRLAGLLDEGCPLPAALDQVPSLLSVEAQMLVRTGWETNSLARSLRDAAELRATRQAAWGAIAGRYSYIVVFVIVLQTIIGFLMYYIMPKFEAIFKDFGMPLPRVTIATIEATHGIVKYGILVFPAIVGGLFLLILFPFTLFNVSKWNIPLIDALFRRRHTTLVLRGLALTVEGGKPIGDGLTVLAREYPSSWIRRRLRRVDEDVRHGRDWVESLHDYGLIRATDAAILGSAQRVGNLAWALRETAGSSERRLGYKIQFWLHLLFPFVVLALGSLVFVLAVAYFAPLVQLIEALAV
jgi:protein transport protein HofC